MGKRKRESQHADRNEGTRAKKVKQEEPNEAVAVTAEAPRPKLDEVKEEERNQLRRQRKKRERLERRINSALPGSKHKAAIEKPIDRPEFDASKSRPWQIHDLNEQEWKELGRQRQKREGKNKRTRSARNKSGSQIKTQKPTDASKENTSIEANASTENVLNGPNATVKDASNEAIAPANSALVRQKSKKKRRKKSESNSGKDIVAVAGDIAHNKDKVSSSVQADTSLGKFPFNAIAPTKNDLISQVKKNKKRGRGKRLNIGSSLLPFTGKIVYVKNEGPDSVQANASRENASIGQKSPKQRRKGKALDTSKDRLTDTKDTVLSKDELSNPVQANASAKKASTKKKGRKGGRRKSEVDGGMALVHMAGDTVHSKDNVSDAAITRHKDLPVSLLKKRKKEDRLKKGKKEPLDSQAVQPFHPQWKVSDPIGGHMLDIDPVFSRDEQFLLIVYDTSIVVHSTSTSLAVRHLPITQNDRITALCLSSVDDSHLYISTLSGIVEEWDWSSGVKLGHWKLSSSTHSLATPIRDVEDKMNRLVYTIDRKKTGPWSISACQLSIENDGKQAEEKILFKHTAFLSSIRVIEGGRFVVATSESQLILGNTATSVSSSLQDLAYKWRVVDCPEWIASIDIRMTYPELTGKKSRGGGTHYGLIDIAVGGLNGSIHVYEDLLGKLIRKEQPNKRETAADITSRKLHWHRNAVLSLKWSLDGNYLISGGQETVIILWQLETGQKQYLPHLGAPIESIVVSPSGSSYGVRLADNSAMVLSTSELQPTFSVAGIQTPCNRDNSLLQLPFVPTIDNPVQPRSTSQTAKFPATVSPTKPSSLLLAVPGSNATRQGLNVSHNAVYLQSFDIGTSQQISRQALTRSKVTNLNMGPEANTIDEPNVTHIQVSCDGKWLATIDEWMSPRSEVIPLSFNDTRISEEQIFRQEIYLKFWSWNDDTKVWELVSRIDNPHAAQFGNPYDQGNVLELSSDPSSVAFATLGLDGIIKTWKPAIRKRNGLDVKGMNGNSLTSWHCKHVIPLQMSDLETHHRPIGGRLAYSQDGSVLAAALRTPTPSPIFLIDTYSGTIASTQSGLYRGLLSGLGILHKYLITLSSDDLHVWDLVTNELSYGIKLHTQDLGPARRSSLSRLAISFQQNLFAIALPEMIPTADGKEVRSQIAIFDPENPAPVSKLHMPKTITTLLPAVGKKGLYTIDSAAQIRTLTPPSVVHSLPQDISAQQNTAACATRGLADILGQPKKAIENGSDGVLNSLSKSGNVVNNRERAGSGGDNDVVVVNQDRLAEIFETGPGVAMPSVTDMFEQVALLVNGRR